jgi:hypothetical protein
MGLHCHRRCRRLLHHRFDIDRRHQTMFSTSTQWYKIQKENQNALLNSSTQQQNCKLNNHRSINTNRRAIVAQPTSTMSYLVHNKPSSTESLLFRLWLDRTRQNSMSRHNFVFLNTHLPQPRLKLQLEELESKNVQYTCVT